MEQSWVMLGSYRSADIRATYEARAAQLEGPQQACHPDALEISLLEHGMEYARVDGQLEVLTGGQYGLIGPGLVHSSWTTNRPAVEYNVHLPVRVLQQVADELGVPWSKVRWARSSFAAGPELLGLVQTLRHEITAEPAPGRELVMTCLATCLSALLLRRHGMAAEEIVDGSAVSTRLRRAEELMRAALAEPFSLDELATAAQMSRYHFLRSFKKHFGMPPYAYLTRLRVERAAELGRSTDLPLTTIAFDVGFGSSGRLTEAFKRVFGVPPSVWRRQHAGRSSVEPEPAAISGRDHSNQREVSCAARS